MGNAVPSLSIAISRLHLVLADNVIWSMKVQRALPTSAIRIVRNYYIKNRLL